MRLHSLELQAIGPYATRQHIDFDKLAISGLFLLEGPTGAGKTTILDAITFALYGGLSGDGSASDRLHSHFAAPDLEPFVTLELSLSGVRYRVRRTPEYQRPKRRGDGFTQQASQVHLERLEDGRWTSLSANKAEVGDAITEAVGLNREQFTQVMLLPQGEFARFLRTDDDGRRVLLTKLFGTQLYDRITDVLEQGRREATKARDAAQARIETATAAAAESAGLEQAERDDLLALGRADRATRLKDIGSELAATIEMTGAALEVASTQLAVTRLAAQAAERQATLMARLTQALRRLREHEATRPEHDQLVAALEAARQAEPVRPLLAALAEAQAVTTSARGTLAALPDAVLPDPALSDPALSDPALSDPALSDPALSDGGLPDATRADDSRDTADEAAAAQHAAAEAAASRAANAETQAAALQHLVDRETALPRRQADVATAQAGAARADELVTSLEAARLELPDKIVAVTERLAAAQLAAAGLTTATEQRAEAEVRLTAAVRAAGFAGRLIELEAAARVAVDNHQRLVDAHQHAMEQRLENMAAELADRLTGGGPCPVCGSTDHPDPATHLAGAVTAEDVEEAADRRDDAANDRAAAEGERDEVTERAAIASAAAGGASEASLTATIAELTQRVEQASQAAELAEQLRPELSGLGAERDKLAEDLRDATAAAATATQQAVDLAVDLARLTQELDEGASEYPTVAARQIALRRAATAQRSLERAHSALAAALTAQASARVRAEQELRATSFATLTAASVAVLPPTEQADLARRTQDWNTTLTSCTAAVRADELAGLDPDTADEVNAAALTTSAELTVAEAAERDVRDALQAWTAKDERLRQRMTELSQAEDDADRLDEETDPVIRLAGLTRGMDGHRRIALTTYVLRLWFDQVVRAANVRLSAMSAGRYELRRTDDGETKRQRSGLTLSVIDRHTGEERSPKSLSGGETFYTSLALALGLADVVRAEAGGVELDTLFIDEGFGSLDSQTLDQVLAVIDELRDRGRAVGIVSHVADLKDRVCERLEVRRLPSGASTVTVRA